MIEEYVNTEELKRLLSTLLIVVGALAIAALFGIIVLPGLRNANRPAAATPVEAVVGEPGWLDPTEFPPARGRVIPPVDARTLMVATPKLIERGNELFVRNCVQCHGEQGKGDGPAAGTLNPRPRDFTTPGGWTNGFDPAGIYRTITGGVKGSAMQAFDYLSKTDRMALVHYVQSMGKFEHGPGNPDAVAALTKELSSAGEKTPNRIPVSMAIAKLEGEFKPAQALQPGASDAAASADLLRRAIVDPARAGATLAGSSAWRTGPRELSSIVLNGAPGNGFAVGAAMMSAADWQALYSELSKTK